MSKLYEAVRKTNSIKPPKCIFIPTREMVRTMIRAIYKWGSTDTTEAFLLRFGLLDDPNWYMNETKRCELASKESNDEPTSD
jgi:hypothetical protein